MQYIIHKDRLIPLRFNLKVLLGTMVHQKNIKLKYSSIMFVVLRCTVALERHEEATTEESGNVLSWRHLKRSRGGDQEEDSGVNFVASNRRSHYNHNSF